MKYASGSLGRVILAKFDNNDVFIEELKKLANKEKLKCAVMVFLGALRKGDLVTGPKKPVIPPSPNQVSFKDGWEVLGVGTIFRNPSGAQIHLHGSMGKKNKVLTGCIRGKSRVFLVIEAVIFELKGIKADKNIDLKTGLNLLRIL